MKMIYLVLMSIIFLISNIFYSQEIEFTSPTMNSEIYGGTSSTLIPLTLTYSSTKDNVSPSSLRIEYVKLYTETGVYYDNIGYGIPSGTTEMPENWNLAPDEYHWILEQYERYLIGGEYVILASCTAHVYFDVVHTIKIVDDLGGDVKVDFNRKGSGFEAKKLINERISVQAFDQEINGYYYIWKLTGSEPSEWTIEKLGGIETSLSSNAFKAYYVETDDNNAVLQSYLRYDDVAPAAPTNLTVSGTPGSTPIQLSWNANSEPDVSSYLVSRKVNYGSWSDIATVTSTSFDDQDWLYATGSTFDVSYKIRAKDINNNISGYSNTVTCNPWPLGKQNSENLAASKSFSNDLSNYPNPFNPTTKIKFSLAKNGYVSIKIYNNLGQEVKELVNAFRESGSYESVFDASNLPSGIYFCKIQSSGFNAVIKLLLTK